MNRLTDRDWQNPESPMWIKLGFLPMENEAYRAYLGEVLKKLSYYEDLEDKEQLKEAVYEFNKHIVSCNECKNYSENIMWESESRPQYFCVKNNHYCKDDWYCADGERK